MYEGEIKRFKVWFEHPQGPYSAIHWGVDHAHVDRVWQSSPFYIGSQAPGETPPGVVAEWFRYHGKPVPLNDESEPREPRQYTAVKRPKVGRDEGEPEDYGLDPDEADYEWDQFVKGDEPNPEWHKMEWPEHDNDDRREAYYQAGLFPPSFLY